MSKSILNKTAGALRVPLPHGKALRLGPHRTGQVSHHDLDHPPLKKLIDNGTIEMTDVEDNEAVPGHGRRGEAPFKS